MSLNITNWPESKRKGAEIGVGMQLREIMTTDVEVIRPETSVSEAAQKMRSLDLGALPVCEDQRLVGMVTDCNITIRAAAYGHDPNTTPVRHYMSSDLICCFEDQDIKEAEELMRQRRVRRLPILTREKQIAGIVALDDLASRAIATRQQQQMEALTAGLQKVSAQLEASKPAPQVVNNP